MYHVLRSITCRSGTVLKYGLTLKLAVPAPRVRWLMPSHISPIFTQKTGIHTYMTYQSYTLGEQTPEVQNHIIYTAAYIPLLPTVECPPLLDTEYSYSVQLTSVTCLRGGGI